MSYFADIILSAGQVFSGKDAPDNFSFVAIKGSRIMGVGTAEQMESFTGPDTKVMNFGEDSFVMPGFHDSHTHLLLAGMYKKFVNLVNARSE